MASNSSGSTSRTGLDKGASNQSNQSNQKAVGGTKDTMAKPQQGDSTKPGAPATPASQTTVNVNSGTDSKPAPTVGQNNAGLRNNPQTSSDDIDM